MAEDSKTYVFGQDCGMLSSLIPLMQKQGIDPNVLALINRDGFGGEGGWFIWVIYLHLRILQNILKMHQI